MGWWVTWGTRGAKPPSSWTKERTELLERAARLGIRITVLEVEPKPLRNLKFKPEIAPDGLVNTDTVASMRREKDY